MKFWIIGFAAGLLVAATAPSASAFGRGVAVRGSASVGPAGGVTTASSARSVSTGPLGGVHSSAVQGRSYTGPGGVSVQQVGVSGASRGPAGGVSGGSAGATRVTGPGGNSLTRAGAVGGSVGPAGGVRVGGASGAAVRTPSGGAAVGSRGGVAVGPYGGASYGSRSSVAVGSYGGVRVGHATTYAGPTAVRTTAAVTRTSFNYPVFTPSFYQVHTSAWVAPRVVVGVNYWRPPVWTTTAAFIGIPSAAPIIYDYGSTVVIQNDVVYVNGDRVAGAAEYAGQAAAIADTGRAAKPVENDEWQPLGVFGAVQDDEKIAQRIFQLAVNKDGIIRGNYYDAVADNTMPVLGSVDKATQRTAWSIGEKKDIVFETGLSNLAKPESTLLVHYGKQSTDQMILVRLEEPKDAK